VSVKPANGIRPLRFGSLARDFRLAVGKTIGARLFIVLLPLSAFAYGSKIDWFSHQ
jgi:hypothetical protein